MRDGIIAVSTSTPNLIRRPSVGLSLMLEADFAQAAQPLFQAGEVDVLEWSFDVGWGRSLPDWAHQLLSFYSEQQRLLGHGVSFSPLSAAWQNRQDTWLSHLRHEVSHRDYQHISEHFGFMTAGDFHQSAPLPVPRTPLTLEIGRDRLARLADACQRSVGLENLAFAFSQRDVEEQGSFLDALLEPVDGFLLLDLHNIYCQACNFDLDPWSLVERYPLDRVRELHVSGGSWREATPGQQIRRDTHDGSVPSLLFELLPRVLERCPQTQYIILERLGGTLAGDDLAFREDFKRLRATIDTWWSKHTTTQP